MCDRKVKRVTEESKWKVDEDSGRNLIGMYKEDKRMHWKVLQKERGTGCNSEEDEVKEDNGKMLKKKIICKKVDNALRKWKIKEKAILICMDM